MTVSVLSNRLKKFEKKSGLNKPYVDPAITHTARDTVHAYLEMMANSKSAGLWIDGKPPHDTNIFIK